MVGAVHVGPDDLAYVVDASCHGAMGAQGIVDGGVNAAAQEEAVDAGGGHINTHDVTRGIDADWLGAAGGQGVVQGREGLDGHGAASWDRLACKGVKSSAAVTRVVVPSATPAATRRHRGQ